LNEVYQRIEGGDGDNYEREGVFKTRGGKTRGGGRGGKNRGGQNRSGQRGGNYYNNQNDSPNETRMDSPQNQGQQGQQGQKSRQKNSKRNYRGPNSLDKPNEKRVGRGNYSGGGGGGPRYRKQRDFDNKQGEEGNKKETVDEGENDNEDQNVNVEEKSDSSEYYPEIDPEEEKEKEKEGVKKEETNTTNQPKKIKGYKSFVETLEKDKHEVDELISKHGLQTKKEDLTSPQIEVNSLSKKDKFEIESERDSFFVKGMDKSQQPQQKVQKKATRKKGSSCFRCS